MRKAPCLFLTICLILSVVSLTLAQEQMTSGGPPKVLRIFREEVKAGKGPAHEKVESAWARAFANAKYPSYILATTSLSGPTEAWFFEGHDSWASIEKTEEGVTKSAALTGVVERFSEQDSAVLSAARAIVAVHREELSYRPNTINVAKDRYFEVVTYRVRPGHDNEFIEARKLVIAAHGKANVVEAWATFQVMAGGLSGTYLMFVPLRSLAEMDAAPSRHGKAYQDALGEDGQKKLRELMGSALLNSEAQVLAFSPKMSFVSKEVAAADPDFWTPKPKPASAKPAPTAKKEATKPGGQ